MNKIENFDVNIFQCVKDGLEPNIYHGYEVLGASKVAMCKRGNLIANKLGIGFQGNAKTLFGQIFENILYSPRVLANIILEINNQLGIEKSMSIDTDKEDYLTIFDKFKLRMHPDIYTNDYTIEVKTSSVYAKLWNKDIAPYQVNQLNTYLGFYKQKYGFLLKINTRAFISDMNNFQEGYWDKVWKKYGFIIPIKFDQEMFDATIRRATEFFISLEEDNFKVECPEFSWECKRCTPDIRDNCGKAWIKCRECSKKMWEWPSTVSDDFKDNPICENCFKKIFPQHSYKKFKYIMKYPWSNDD